MKTTILTLILCVATSVVFSQKDSTARPFTAARPNAVTIDFGGNSPIFALNYRRNVKQFAKSFIEVSAGLGVGYQYNFYGFNPNIDYLTSSGDYIINPYPDDAGFKVSIPHSITYVIQRGRRTFWELGYSAMYLTQKRFQSNGSELSSGYLPGLAAGYRFQSPKTGLMLRIYGQSNLLTTQTSNFRNFNTFVKTTYRDAVFSFGMSMGKSF